MGRMLRQASGCRMLIPALLLALVMMLPAIAAPPPSGQGVAQRLTGAMVVAQLGKLQRAVEARALQAPQHAAKLKSIAGQLGHMQAALKQILGNDAMKPVATIGKRARADAMRAAAAAKRVGAWLDIPAAACTPGEIDAVLSVLSTTVTTLGDDTSSQSDPLPIIDGVQTLDKRPLFVLRPGGKQAPKFILTGANLLDTQCANPKVVVLDAQGKPVSAQPHLVGAQPSRVELAWPGLASLPAGTYVVQLTAQRKAFLFGCKSEPTTMAAVAVTPPQHFVVTYTLAGSCGAKGQPVTLANGKLPPVGGSQRSVSKAIALPASCQNPTSYTLKASVATADGKVSRYGPVTQGAGVTVTTGLGHGLTMQWDPFQRQLFVRAGNSTCKAVY